MIVNTTSQNLDITKGVVSASILKGAGDELKREIAKFPVINKGSSIIRVNFGDVVETMGYRLECQRVFHGPLHYWKSDQPGIALKVSTVYSTYNEIAFIELSVTVKVVIYTGGFKYTFFHVQHYAWVVGGICGNYILYQIFITKCVGKIYVLITCSCNYCK